uniref:SoxR reducing system RseC family protein n=3 Tax=unclassified Prevotella TaxID=2638335 RepID=A0AB33JJH2_9BACT
MAFQLNQLEKAIDDIQQQVSNKIRVHQGEEGFPKMEDYQLNDEQLTDYLFDKQAILDSLGSERTKLTVSGFLIVLPILAMSLYPQDRLPWGQNSIFVGVGIGFGLYLLYRAIGKAYIHYQLKKLYNPQIEEYIDRVLSYNK